METRLLGYILLGEGALLALGVFYLNSARREVPLVFSPSQVLGATCQDYRFGYHDPSGGVVDRSRQDVTTSEGESYAMLRAVWMNDQQTFDTSWQWVKDNLKRPNDRLSSWLFGQHADGSYGVLTEQGG